MKSRLRNSKRFVNWRCPLCESNKYKAIEKHSAQSKILVRTKLITCNECTVKSVYPMPSEAELERFNKSYWKDVQPENQESCEFFYSQAEYRTLYLKKYINHFPGMKILDIGSGHAFIYEVLKLQNGNVDYSAVESDLEMQSTLRNKGIKQIYSNWQLIKETDFDVIILSHVLEHFVEPVKFLIEIKGLLKENGYIFVEVPNQDDTFKVFLGAHLLVFNEISLTNFFEKLNMNIINLVTVGENIENLRKSEFKKFVIKYLPQIVTIKEMIKNTIHDKSKNKGRFLVEHKFDHYGNNGRWIRMIAQKK